MTSIGPSKNNLKQLHILLGFFSWSPDSILWLSNLSPWTWGISSQPLQRRAAQLCVHQCQRNPRQALEQRLYITGAAERKYPTSKGKGEATTRR